MNDLIATSGLTTSSQYIAIKGNTSPFSEPEFLTFVKQGATVQEIVGDDASVEVVVLINGHIVPKELWSKVRPKVGAEVMVIKLPEGGDNAAFAMIMMVALSVFAGPAGTAVSASMFGGSALAANVVTGAIYLMAGAMIAPSFSAEDLGATGEFSAQGKYNALTSSGNSANLYGVIPKNYGTIWFKPPLAAKTHTEISGGDKQYLNAMFCLGYGGQKIMGHDFTLGSAKGVIRKSGGNLTSSGFTPDLTHMMIGDTTIDNFDDFDIEVGYKDDLTLFRNDIGESTVSVDLFTDGDSTIRSTEDNASEANIDLVFPNSIMSRNSRGESARPASLLGMSLGSAYTSNQVTIDNSNPELGVITVHSDRNLYFAPSVTSGTHTLTFSATWYTQHYRNDTEVENIAYYVMNFTVNNGVVTVNSMTRNGGNFTDYNTAMNVIGDGIAFKIEYAPTGTQSWTVAHFDDHTHNELVLIGSSYGAFLARRSGNTNDPFAVNRRIVFPSAGKYDIKITREKTYKTYSNYVYTDATWSTLRSIKPTEPFNIPDVLLCAVRIKASEQLNGRLDTVSFKATSLLRGLDDVVIPSGNPALVYLDAMRGIQCANPVPDSNIDMDSITEWHDWCDSKGLTYSWSHNSDDTLIQRLDNITSSSFASRSIVDTKFGVVTDLNTTPTHAITPRNSQSLVIRKQFMDLPHAFRVRYVDPEVQQEVERVVYADGYDETNATKFEVLSTQGITTPGHAYKYGRYHLAQLTLRPETFTVRQGIESLGLTRGDIAKISYDTILVGLGWARVASYDSTTVTLDAGVEIESGIDYAVSIRHSDNSQTVTTVTGSVGINTVLNWSAPPTGLLEGDLVTFGESGKTDILGKVTIVEPNGDFGASITLTNAAIGILDTFSEAIPLFDHGMALPSTLKLPPPPTIESLASDQSQFFQSIDGSYQASINIRWSGVINPEVVTTIEAEYSLIADNDDVNIPLGEYVTVDSRFESFNASYGSADLKDVIEDAWYEVRLRAVTIHGVKSLPSAPSVVKVLNADAVAATPPAVTNLTVVELINHVDRQPIAIMSATWEHDYIYDATYVVHHKVADGAWEVSAILTQPEYAFKVPTVGFEGQDLTVVVQAFSRVNKALSLTDSTQSVTQIVGDVTVPSDIQNFDLDVLSESAMINWTKPSDPDISHYTIKFSNDIINASWARSTTLIESVAFDQTTVKVANRIGTYLIKAVDTSGNVSANATRAVTSIASLNGVDLQEVVDDSPTWNGTKHNLVVDGIDRIISTEIVANESYAQEGQYTTFGVVDLGDIYTVRMIGNLTAYALDMSQSVGYMSDWDNLLDLQSLTNMPSEEWDAHIEVRYAESIETMSDWSALSDVTSLGVPDTGWTAWKRFNTGDYTGRIFQFKVVYTVSNQNVRVFIEEFTVDVDTVERTESDFDITAPSNGMRVNYTHEFYKKAVINITRDNAAKGDYHIVTNNNSSGFDISFLDVNDNPISAQFDYVATGTGRRELQVVR